MICSAAEAALPFLTGKALGLPYKNLPLLRQEGSSTYAFKEVWSNKERGKVFGRVSGGVLKFWVVHATTTQKLGSRKSTPWADLLRDLR